MVSSITPGTTGAAALGVDPRYARPQTPPRPHNENTAAGDRVQVSDAATWAAARESVRAGLEQLQSALVAGQDAFGLLGKISGLAQGGEGSQADLNDTIAQLKQRIDDAIAGGARVLAGTDVSVQAEPGAPELTIAGLDLRVKDEPAGGDVISVPSNAQIDDPGLARLAQRSLDALQTGMDRLLDAMRALDAHQGFIGAAQSSLTGVRTDLDADAARLLALQVRQGLDASQTSIANVEPQAVLSLFRS